MSNSRLPESARRCTGDWIATMDGNGVVDHWSHRGEPGLRVSYRAGVSVIEPTSGLPTTAVVAGDIVATIGIGQIDVTGPAVGGQGYQLRATVTITDVGGVDRFASATANVSLSKAPSPPSPSLPLASVAPATSRLASGSSSIPLPGLGPTGANNLGQYIPWPCRTP